jgi:hypothetical protein
MRTRSHHVDRLPKHILKLPRVVLAAALRAFHGGVLPRNTGGVLALAASGRLLAASRSAAHVRTCQEGSRGMAHVT